jgi:hypothetical protein
MGCGEKSKEELIEGVRLIKVQYIRKWNTMAKPLWTMNMHLNNEGQECKTGPVKEEDTSGKGDERRG